MLSIPFRPAPLHQPLPIEKLRWHCPLDLIPAETTEAVSPIEGIIGQDRALQALKLGIELYGPGYNIFVSGLSGTGKATTIKTILEKIQSRQAEARDYCYVHNFADPDRPCLLMFEAGEGKKFKSDMDETMSMVVERMPGRYEDEDVQRKRQALIDEFNQLEMELFTEYEQRITPDGFVLGRIQDGQTMQPEILVKLGEKSVLLSDLPAAVEEGLLTEEEVAQYTETYGEHKRALRDVLRRGIKLSREYQKKILEHERREGALHLLTLFQDMLDTYTDQKVQEYLNTVMENILENLEQFRSPGDEDTGVPVEFEVNLLLDNSRTSCCPVIVETIPTFRNLFGTIERKQDARGFYSSDFTSIKPGSLLQADGGFLVINAADALTEPGVWKSLQRVLLYRKLEIQSPEMFAQQSISAMKPEAIDVNVKVILIGNNEIYWALSTLERDFKKIFKIKAEFDYEMPNTDIAVIQYTALVRKLIADEGLRHFDKHAIAGIVEYGARLVDHQRKLTTQFSEIADIVREANYWCGQNSHKYVTAVHVDKAIEETYNRHALYEDKLQEMIQEEILLIDIEGERVGQINGLAIHGGERFAFGKPTRITASVSAGKSGIINIEREARMSGSTHDKGVLILSGFILEQFAKERPLSLTASISFEQSYSGIDGDSASSTEAYALLSALTELPIKQSIAVTGSINQKGDIQPIGGVNQKIEGFFEVCERRGLTGDQGVIIPIQNVDNLMLRGNVVEAVRAGTFHVWAVRNVCEGIELLTGVEAGERDANGQYPPETIFGMVERRLKRLRENVREAEVGSSD